MNPSDHILTFTADVLIYISTQTPVNYIVYTDGMGRWLGF